MIARTTTTVAPYVSVQPSDASKDDFWWALDGCESTHGAISNNRFQFMGGTAEKVGYYPGAPYAEQREMAKGWAARLRAQGTHPGSTSGWPECWWVAKAEVGYEGG